MCAQLSIYLTNSQMCVATFKLIQYNLCVQNPEMHELVERLSDIIVQFMILAWKLAWAVSMGHLTRKLSEPLEISRWRPFFKMADTLVEQLSDIVVYLVIQAWKLAWAVSVGHLTISHLQLLEISRWRPFFKMATTLVEQLGLRNHLVGDTSMKIAMSCLKGSFDKKPPTATWNFKMAAFFFKITTT